MPRRRKFTCEVCFELKPKKQKMPDKTSCRCVGKICAECFYNDFFIRQRLHIVYNGGAAKCQDQDPNSEVDMILFYENDYGKTAEEMVDLCYRGRTCPFCNMMQMWKNGEHPHVLESTGRMTFWAPKINWNAPENIRHTTQPPDQEVDPGGP